MARLERVQAIGISDLRLPLPQIISVSNAANLREKTSGKHSKQAIMCVSWRFQISNSRGFKQAHPSRKVHHARIILSAHMVSFLHQPAI